MTFDPSDQPGDPLDWGGNQLGHMMITGAMSAALSLGGASDNWSTGPVVAVWFLWEARHYRIGRRLGIRARRIAVDCLTDFAAMVWGVTILIQDPRHWVLIGPLCLLPGVVRRLRRSK